VQITLGLAGPGSRWNQSGRTPAGFLAGFWHGLLFPLSFWISLLFPSVRIYETKNSGRWYDFGFLIGSGTTISTGTSQLEA
jgi:hypothetical protein